MFERFTERSRRVLVLAQEEAAALGHTSIGTEHLLLGLLAEVGGVAAVALRGLGMDIADVRQRVAGASPRQPVEAARTQVPFAPEAKSVLELSLREALQLGHNYIGTEHLLLGLVRHGSGLAAQIMAAMDLDTTKVRSEVIRVMTGGTVPQAEAPSAPTPTGPDASPPRCPRCRRDLAGNVASRRLAVPGEADQSPIEVVMVYCRACGVALTSRISEV